MTDMWWDGLLPEILSALIATSLTALLVAPAVALCAWYFNHKLSVQAHRRAVKMGLVKDTERFCDELMELAVSYWVNRTSLENLTQMNLLAHRISSYHYLLMRFYSEHFPENREVLESWYEINQAITGGRFKSEKREADTGRIMLSVSAIVNLRLAVFRTLNDD